MPVDKSQMSEVRILSKSSCDLPESDLEETLTVAESTSLPILPTKESGAFSIDKVILYWIFCQKDSFKHNDIKPYHDLESCIAFHDNHVIYYIIMSCFLHNYVSFKIPMHLSPIYKAVYSLKYIDYRQWCLIVLV